MSGDPETLGARPRGRPSLYDAAYCGRVLELAAEGCCKAEIAAKLGVAGKRLDAWAAVHPEFRDALRRARALEYAWWLEAGRKGSAPRAGIWRVGSCRCATASASASRAAPPPGGPPRAEGRPNADRLREDMERKLSRIADAWRGKFLASLTPGEFESLGYDWRFWARPEQRAPLSDWHTWMILAGRGAGKTRCGAEWVRRCVCGPTPLGGGVYSRLALVAETAADARDVIVEGPAGLLAIHPADFRPKFERSKRRLTWPNGAVATLYNATEPDQLRGPQHEAAWCDELAKWRYARETWDMLQFGLRLGERPRQVITTTPRPIPLIREFLAREGQGVAVTRGSTYDNRANLAPGFFKAS